MAEPFHWLPALGTSNPSVDSGGHPQNVEGEKKKKSIFPVFELHNLWVEYFPPSDVSK